MAQCSSQTFSVGGTVEIDSNTNFENTKPNKKLSNSGNNQIACFEDLPVEEVTVYGRATIVTFSFIRFWWSPNPGGNGGSGGSGSNTTTFGNVDANAACEALGATDRINLVNAAFIAARILAGTGAMQFMLEYPAGTTFSLTLPNGSTIIGIVSAASSATTPIMTEASNSCG